MNNINNDFSQTEQILTETYFFFIGEKNIGKERTINLYNN